MGECTLVSEDHCYVVGEPGDKRDWMQHERVLSSVLNEY